MSFILSEKHLYLAAAVTVCNNLGEGEIQDENTNSPLVLVSLVGCYLISFTVDLALCLNRPALNALRQEGREAISSSARTLWPVR